MDALDDILSHVRMRGSVFRRAELDAPFGVETSGAPAPIFHAVVGGSAYIKVAGERKARRLAEGDVVLLPHGHGHIISDDPRRATVPISSLPHRDVEESVPTVFHGGSGARTSIVCGIFKSDPDHEAHPLLPLLPPVVHVSGDGGTTSRYFETVLRMLRDELDSQRPGASTVVARLTDVLLVQILRAWVESLADGEGGWLGALRDPRIASALARIHNEPDESWTVERLAKASGMSRSSFHERFTRLVGQSPARYLLSWRMHLAADALRRGDARVGELAGKLGYESESAFSQAFRRVIGVRPLAYKTAAAARR